MVGESAYFLDDHSSDHVRNSAKFIVDHSAHVKIQPEAVADFAKKLSENVLPGEIDLERWKKHILHPKTNDQSAVDWIFLADSLNYSFWSSEQDATRKYAVRYKGNLYTGWWSLCACINRALEEGIPILDPKYYSKITEEELRKVFRTDTEGEMPLVLQRLESLREVGSVLLQKFDGTFANCIKQANGSSQELLKIILENFPSYRDESVFRGRRVSFLKRAQILISDIWACFEGQGMGEFHDIDKLTIFADYRIPQVLEYFGIITYDQELRKKIDTGYMFENGEESEMEIRGATIWACELLVEELKRYPGMGHINAVLLDHYLWDYRQMHNDKMTDLAFHRTRCIFY